MNNLLERITYFLSDQKSEINEVKGLTNSFAKKSGKSIKEVERLWNKSKRIVSKQYPDIENESEKFFQLVVGVLKKMLKIDG